MTEGKLKLGLIRKDYQRGVLLENKISDDPVVFFEKWIEEAIKAKIEEVNAMVLSTTDRNSRPHSRIVLLKGIEQGTFHFFTNYNSAKGIQMADQSEVAALFFWKELERQVRIEGKVEKLTAEQSDNYFYSRPLDSRISAVVSPQSQTIPNRKELEDKAKNWQRKQKNEIIRPTHWGGYKIIPDYIEFWQGRHSRLHDRIVFIQQENNSWKKQRLAP